MRWSLETTVNCRGEPGKDQFLDERIGVFLAGGELDGETFMLRLPRQAGRRIVSIEHDRPFAARLQAIERFGQEV